MQTSIYSFLSLGLLILPTTLAQNATIGTNCDVASTVTVKAGDNLSSISDANKVTLAQTIFVNPQIANVRNINPGDIINIPNAACIAPTPKPLAEPTAICSNGTALTVKVAEGDTLIIIAKEKLGITLPSLLAANTQIADPNKIAVGDVINVPLCGKTGSEGGNGTTTNAPKSTGGASASIPKASKAPKRRSRRSRVLY